MTDEERAQLESSTGYEFRQVEWLERALTHSSLRGSLAVGSPQVDNERLEFLGDAVLGLIVSEYLLREFPGWSEGKLSKSKARLVSAWSLYAVGQRMGLGRHLRLGAGEDKTGGRLKRTLLADAYEAVVGAIYLDGGLDAAARFVRVSLIDPAVREQAEALAAPDHKSALQEWLQARGWPPAEYGVIRETGPDHAKTFVVEARVRGRVLASSEAPNKKEAEQGAAQLAMAKLLAETVVPQVSSLAPSDKPEPPALNYRSRVGETGKESNE